jgi:hypothetical protein
MDDAAAKAEWSVYRQDIHGVQYEMRRDLPREDAIRIAQEFNDKGHHQTYWSGLPKDHPKIDRTVRFTP